MFLRPGNKGTVTACLVFCVSRGQQYILIGFPFFGLCTDFRGSQWRETIEVFAGDVAIVQHVKQRIDEVADGGRECIGKRFTDLGAGKRNLVFRSDGKDADLEELAAIGQPVYAPRLLQIVGFAARLRGCCEVD